MFRDFYTILLQFCGGYVTLTEPISSSSFRKHEPELGIALFIIYLYVLLWRGLATDHRPPADGTLPAVVPRCGYELRRPFHAALCSSRVGCSGL